MNMPRRRESKYPWDVWLDGGIHRLRKGTHFEHKWEIFSQMVRTTAYRWQVFVSVIHRVERGADVLYVQSRRTGLTLAEKAKRKLAAKQKKGKKGARDLKT